MAKSKGKSATKVAAPQYASYVEKATTATQKAFADWIVANTGYQVDETSVKLASRLSSAFRSSPERVALKAERKAERENHAAAVEQRRQERAEKRAAALEAKAKAIREGKVRGPGRPRKVAEAAPVEPEAEAAEEDFSEDATVEVVPDESEDEDFDEDDEDFGDEDDEDEDF